MVRTHLLVTVAVAGLLAGCGSNEPTTPSFAPTDPAGPLFAPDHIVEVALEMDPADWDAMRRQSRTWASIVAAPDRQCNLRPFVKPFTWFRASVTVDGVRREVTVRKKGLFGSVTDGRPALKVRFDGVDPDQTLFGLKRLTLNNSFQDPTWLRQCLAYQVFAKAGAPVPWCNFAHLTVNGRDLGLYVHLESADRRWLRRNFERDEGDLWEGEFSDFRAGWMATYEKKGDVEDDDQTKVDRSTLQAVADAVAQDVPDSEVRGRLEKLIDFDGFMRFWATEKILEHWDGYTNNTNNYFVYRNPADGRFVFAPSGTDQITRTDPNDDALPPVSVYAAAALSKRLYAILELRQLYVDTLRQLLDSAFHEDELLAEIDRMQALVTPVLARAGEDLDKQAQAVAALRSWIAGRRAALVDDLRNGPREWSGDPVRMACADLLGSVQGSFATWFGTLTTWDALSIGSGTIKGEYRGQPFAFWRVGALAGFDPNAQSDPWAVVDVTGFSPDGSQITIWIAVRPTRFQPGTTVVLDGVDAGGAVYGWSPSAWQWTYLGNLDGQVELDAAGVTQQAPVSGRFKANVIRW